MYEIIKSVINSKDYELRDMLYKINKMYIESAITEEQKAELDELARENAKAENSCAPLKNQIEDIYSKLAQITSRLETLENKESTEEPTESVEPEEDEYPEYVQPTGAHDAYNTGAKITFKGERYTCQIDGCVWSPEEYPAGWKKEETTESES